MATVTLTFPDDESAESFVGWFLDGGGEYQWNEGRESEGDPWMESSWPVSADGTKTIEPLRDITFKATPSRLDGSGTEGR